jgi:hypothetical protein
VSTISLHAEVVIDPAVTTAAEAAAYLTTLSGLLGLTAPAGAAPAGPVTVVDQQLDRLTNHSPMFASRLRKLHAALIALGYVPTLPKPKTAGKPLPSYISYVDPTSGVNFGNANSEKFYVMRKDLRDELAALPQFGADSRYANCALVSDDAVDALLKIAEREKK